MTERYRPHFQAAAAYSPRGTHTHSLSCLCNSGLVVLLCLLRPPNLLPGTWGYTCPAAETLPLRGKRYSKPLNTGARPAWSPRGGWLASEMLPVYLRRRRGREVDSLRALSGIQRLEGGPRRYSQASLTQASVHSTPKRPSGVIPYPLVLIVILHFYGPQPDRKPGLISPMGRPTTTCKSTQPHHIGA